MSPKPGFSTFFFAARPQYLSASISPVLVATALAYSIYGSFNFLLFLLAALAIMFFHAGANIANDYFDHTSRNDWLNKNPTPFSGGSQFIQRGLLTPKQTLITAIITFAIGTIIGLAIVYLTKSSFIFILGLIGLFGAFFYTASPLRLGYRGIGEILIMFLFGFLPAAGAYYLQTNKIDFIIFWPAAIVGILIFLVILINEIPDLPADSQVGKKTLVVIFGIDTSILIYKTMLAATYIIAAVSAFIDKRMCVASVCYFFTLPIAIKLVKIANKQNLTMPGQYAPNKFTIILHTTGMITLTAGFIASHFFNLA